MADPICRWRNPYFPTVRELISVIPRENLPKDIGRQLTNEASGSEDFFRTAYQLAAQLGLYYEDDFMFYSKFHNIPHPFEINSYTDSWFRRYYVPNPYTARGFANIQPKILYIELCKLLYDAQAQIPWAEVKESLFAEEIGNDDILINVINTYSRLFQVKNKTLQLKEGIQYEDLQSSITSYTLPERNDKKGFFEHFPTESSENVINLTSVIKTDELYRRDKKHFEGKNIIYYGAPGTGKSFIVDQKIKDLNPNYFERVTFHPEYDNASFVGGYKPVSVKNADEKDEISYRFVPQAFSSIYSRAWLDATQQYYLVIEEINRGNCAEIFGEIFQLLDRNSEYTVTPSKELREFLLSEFSNDGQHPGIIRGLKLPPNLTILATMNTSDQSLFPMDSAFKRRWVWEYVPICYDRTNEEGELNPSYDYEIDIADGNKYGWLDFISKINNNHIKNNPSLGMDKCIGNYFIKPDSGNSITLKPFVNKVIFYLWNDVFKDEDNKVFESNGSYEDFFPVSSAGKVKIKELFQRIELSPAAGYGETEEVAELGAVAEEKPTLGL